MEIIHNKLRLGINREAIENDGLSAEEYLTRLDELVKTFLPHATRTVRNDDVIDYTTAGEGDTDRFLAAIAEIDSNEEMKEWKHRYINTYVFYHYPGWEPDPKQNSAANGHYVIGMFEVNDCIRSEACMVARLAPLAAILKKELHVFDVPVSKHILEWNTDLLEASVDLQQCEDSNTDCTATSAQ